MITIFSVQGTKKGTTKLPKNLSGAANMKLLAQAIRVYEDLLHSGTARVKTRGEVRASGAKIYRQKGTGKARHGDIAAPIFAGGGIAHGPKGLKRILTLPRKMRKSALGAALNLKEKKGEIVVVEGLSGITKTKDAQNLLKVILKGQDGLASLNSAIVARDLKNKNVELAFRNIKGVNVVIFDHLNALTVFKSGFLIIDGDAISKKEKAVSTQKRSSQGKPVTSRKVSVSKPKKLKSTTIKAKITRKKK